MSQHNRELRSPIEAAGNVPNSTAFQVAQLPLRLRFPPQRWTIWIVFMVMLMILAAVAICSRWSIRGLLPPLIQESGRSHLDANYSPWEVAFPSISLDIPRLATAASRGEDNWSAGNPPLTATFTPLPPAAVVPTDLPTPTVQPTAPADTDGGSTGGGSNPPPATSQPPSTATPATDDSGGGSGSVSCGSPCSSDADCSGLGSNPVCAGGSCYDAQVCGNDSGGGGDGGDGGSGGDNPTPPSGVQP